MNEKAIENVFSPLDEGDTAHRFKKCWWGWLEYSDVARGVGMGVAGTGRHFQGGGTSLTKN